MRHAVLVAQVPEQVRALPDAALAGAVHAEGKCAAALLTGRASEDLWHPTTRRGHDLAPGPGYARRARQACHGCPVTPQCLEWALRRESRPGAGAPEGIYGALSPHERAQLLAQRRAAHKAHKRQRRLKS